MEDQSFSAGSNSMSRWFSSHSAHNQIIFTVVTTPLIARPGFGVYSA